MARVTCCGDCSCTSSYDLRAGEPAGRAAARDARTRALGSGSAYMYAEALRHLYCCFRFKTHRSGRCHVFHWKHANRARWNVQREVARVSEC
eukprot:scaffold4943_cov261-Prasinococcus_capsulatus_cf.AAC.1